MKRLLLISNSTQHGSGFLDHCSQELINFWGDKVKRVLFVPFAGGDYDAYAQKVRTKLQEFGYETDSLHEATDPVLAVKNAQSIFIGGGNTFRLLDRLYQLDLIKEIRNAVEFGTPYVGISAGTNVATVSIKTTNDMPIVYPPSFMALNLVPFNINPHYLDTHPEKYHGETREQRINEFHEINDSVVVGLREGTMLHLENNTLILKGISPARIFRKGQAPEEYPSGSDLSFLI